MFTAGQATQYSLVCSSLSLCALHVLSSSEYMVLMSRGCPGGVKVLRLACQPYSASLAASSIILRLSQPDNSMVQLQVPQDHNYFDFDLDLLKRGTLFPLRQGEAAAISCMIDAPAAFASPALPPFPANHGSVGS